VVVVAPNGPGAVFIYAQLSDMFTGKKCFPYFMDDWLYQSRQKWAGGNIRELAKKLLTENDSWMMISESLGNILSARYEIQPKHILVIHNPVDMQGVVPTAAVKKKNNFVLAYAGALWPMHFDALMVMAKAIQLLQDEVAVKLVIYTGESNWQWRKEALEAAGVEYGGHVPYSQIHETLSKADVLLLTASFTKEWETHSRGSVQTKITDYLKAGRLIIGCGPEYAAGHHFLKTHQCGVCIETNDVERAAMALKEILEHLDLKQALVQNGYTVLKNEFSFEVVHKKLKQFLAA
jgi:glycosyltransferase involved in cell wall biosynthesis